MCRTSQVPGCEHTRTAVPTFLAPGTVFVEENFSMDRRRGGGVGLGIIQTHYIHCAFISIMITSAPLQIIKH